MKLLSDWFTAPFESYRTSNMIFYLLCIFSAAFSMTWPFFVLLTIALVKMFIALRKWSTE